MPSKILPFARPGLLLPASPALDDAALAATIGHAGMARLYRQWLDWAVRAGGLPDRGTIRPEDLRPWLGHLAIVDIERNPFRLRYRLVGTRLTELLGHELTGRYVDELYSRRVRREATEAYRSVIEARRPHYRHARFWLVLKTVGYHRLILPFTRDGKSVDTCLLALYPDRPEIVRAADWQGPLDRARHRRLVRRRPARQARRPIARAPAYAQEGGRLGLPAPLTRQDLYQGCHRRYNPVISPQGNCGNSSWKTSRTATAQSSRTAIP
ncbi:MAG: PAS domain-containing protein [Rhodospirillaceae bacterium]|nr:PAS domain-containing protein [Rhodospirillaceae bacterium]